MSCPSATYSVGSDDGRIYKFSMIFWIRKLWPTGNILFASLIININSSVIKNFWSRNCNNNKK